MLTTKTVKIVSLKNLYKCLDFNNSISVNHVLYCSVSIPDCAYNPFSMYVRICLLYDCLVTFTLLIFIFQKLGYCQGMSSLAALLLTYLNEEDAFWGMVTLIGDHKYAMHGEFYEVSC